MFRLSIYEPRGYKAEIDICSCSIIKRDGLCTAGILHNFAIKQGGRSVFRALCDNLIEFALQAIGKTFITFIGDYGKNIGVVDEVLAEDFRILADAILIYAKAKPTTNLLAFLNLGIRFAERTDLKNVRIIPAFSQGRMRENKAHRLLEIEQALFVFHNKIVCRNVIGPAFLLLLTIYDMSFFVN